MKETWLFQKARVLAIFDDLDTILLMVPLKVVVVGLKWELAVDLFVVLALLALIWVYLHRLKIPCSWQMTMVYAACVAAVCELVHFFTHSELTDPNDLVDTMHLEVLLPAFAIGCMSRSGHTSQMPVDTHHASGAKLSVNSLVLRKDALKRRMSVVFEKDAMDAGETMSSGVSATFMVLVGLSMPALFGSSDGGGGHRRLDGEEGMPAGAYVLHVVIVSLLMVVGKMFPTFCYKDEANVRTRLALSLGMCPRGEFGAGVIVISLGFGIEGEAITIAVICLALNLVASSGFIMAVKKLAQETSVDDAADISEAVSDPPRWADWCLPTESQKFQQAMEPAPPAADLGTAGPPSAPVSPISEISPAINAVPISPAVNAVERKNQARQSSKLAWQARSSSKDSARPPRSSSKDSAPGNGRRSSSKDPPGNVSVEAV